MSEPNIQEDKIYDVVIVGAGVAGALVAYELVKAGKSVLMLEAGPDETSLKDRNLLVENYYKAFPKTPESAYPDVPPARKATTAALFDCPYDGYLVQKDCFNEVIPDKSRNNWFKSTYERRVGGTTWHWLGTSLRYVPTDFKMKSTYPDLPAGFVDWPIDYWDLYPWYEKAEAEMGVSGNPNFDLGAPRKDPKTGKVAQYPMPEIPMSYLDKKVASAVDGQTVPIPGYEGFKIEVHSTPQARNSVGGYQQRPQCCGNSSCIPICPIHAKYDGSVHVNLARNHYGSLFKLQAQSVAYKIDVSKESGEISGIHYKKWEKKGNDYPYKEYTAKGRIYVIAAHAIESPKLLLISATDELPYGVANSSNRVGKYLMDHNTQLSFALTAEPVFPFRGPLSTSGIESLKNNKARGRAGAFRIEIGNDAWEWPEDAPFQQVQGFLEGWQLRWDNENSQMLKQKIKPLFGKELAEKLKEEMNREIRLASLVEPTPMIDHFVAPSNKTDVLGIPRPYTQYGISDDPYCINGMLNAIKVQDQILKSLGAKEVYHKPVEQFAGAGHIMGTCRMGNNPKESVIDKYQRSHDHNNLFIVGSSVFPTVGASNPTLTIGALSLWAAESIIKQLGS